MTGDAPVFVIPDVDRIPLGADGPTSVDGSTPDLTVIPGGAGGPALTDAQVASIIEFPFAFWALRHGKHWALSDDESAMLAEPLTRKLNEHAAAARLVRAGGDWTVIGGSLVLIISARLMEDASRATDTRARGGPRAPSPAAGDDPGTSGGDPWLPGGNLGGNAGPVAGGPGGGTLNGLRLPGGAPDLSGDPAVAAETPGPVLRQAL